MSTRRGREVCDPCALPFMGGDPRTVANLNILINNIQLYSGSGVLDRVMPLSVQRWLVCRGMAAYNRQYGLWAACAPASPITEYGPLPESVYIYDRRGRISAPERTTEDGGDWCIFPANAHCTPVAPLVAAKVKTLEFIESAVRQNVDSTRAAMAVTYDDKDFTVQIDQAAKDLMKGKPVVKFCRTAANNVELTQFGGVGTSYLPDLLALYENTKNELDGIVGRIALGEKSERRITDEVTAIENAAMTSIDVIIDTFNNFAKYYNIDVVAARGHILERSPVETRGSGEAAGGEQ